MFMWIEQRTEGTRNQRIKLDKAPWSLEKVVRKSLKHAMWLALAFYTAFTFVAYFTDADELIFSFLDLTINIHALVWTGIFTALTYLNAGWLREQVCMYMCPYARFQSAMFDPNTLVVSYDPARGEPRGSRKKGVDYRSQGLGDCIDCELCVQVCPTGIDIRKGLQYECIGCALCIDACNSIMDKMEYPRGLIRYTSENALKGQAPKKHLLLRPATLGYLLAITAMVCLFSWKVIARVPLKLDIIRDRNQLFEDKGDYVENSYTAKVLNMTEQEQKLVLTIINNEQARFTGDVEIEIASGELAERAFRIRLPKEQINAPVLSLVLELHSSDTQLRAQSETSFLSAGNPGHE